MLTLTVTGRKPAPSTGMLRDTPLVVFCRMALCPPPTPEADSTV
jgi:hypothetical protein